MLPLSQMVAQRLYELSASNTDHGAHRGSAVDDAILDARLVDARFVDTDSSTGWSESLGVGSVNGPTSLMGPVSDHERKE